MAIHIHLARAAKPVRDATQPSIGEKVMCNGYPGVIRKVHTGQLSGMVDVKLESGTVTVEHSSLKPVRDASGLVKDSVESVEKEIRTQQRLMDVAKRMGKDVPGQVMQRMAFLKEELEKAKNPRTDDAITDKSRALARKCHQYLSNAVDMAEETADELDGADKARARQARDSIRKAMQEITPLC